MVYADLPAIYYHINLDVTKESLLAGGLFRCTSGLSYLLSVCSKHALTIINRTMALFHYQIITFPKLRGGKRPH